MEDRILNFDESHESQAVNVLLKDEHLVFFSDLILLVLKLALVVILLLFNQAQKIRILVVRQLLMEELMVVLGLAEVKGLRHKFVLVFGGV